MRMGGFVSVLGCWGRGFGLVGLEEGGRRRGMGMEREGGEVRWKGRGKGGGRGRGRGGNGRMDGWMDGWMDECTGREGGAKKRSEKKRSARKRTKKGD